VQVSMVRDHSLVAHAQFWRLEPGRRAVLSVAVLYLNAWKIKTEIELYLLIQTKTTAFIVLISGPVDQ